MVNINFIQSTSLYTIDGQLGLFDLFLTKLNTTAITTEIFTPFNVVVPNLTMANFVNDQITKHVGICSNIQFPLLSGFIEKIYLLNNPQDELFNFDNVSFILYDYLCQCDLSINGFQEIRAYLEDQKGNLIIHKAFQLALQLQAIFHEYIYLRTEDLLKFNFSRKLSNWQKILWQHLLDKIGSRKSYLDIYSYFINAKEIQYLPAQLSIFALNNLYPSQLAIIKQMAKGCQVNWYYLAISNHYYGDLLSSRAQERLQKKILRAPDLVLEDLYLTDGNPLVANLASQSREFNELLLANDIFADDFQLTKPLINEASSLLEVIQHDIREILYRVDPKYYLHKSSQCYALPLKLNNSANSVKINICHNRMREVQVMFNEIAAYLNTNPHITLEQILVTAPNIDVYAPYIDAVFSNEYVEQDGGIRAYFPFTITGNKIKRDFRILETLKFILNLPYLLPVTYLFELLGRSDISQNLNLSVAEINLIHSWLLDNKTKFGYDAKDYALFDYQNHDVHSLKRLLNNLLLGFCLPNSIFKSNDKLPLYNIEGSAYIPYDNLENSQLELCNKFIGLIDLLVNIRNKLYCGIDNYQLMTTANVIELIEMVRDNLVFYTDDILIIDEFIGKLRLNDVTSPINLLIINQLIDDYCSSFNTKVLFNGKLICSSMQAMRNIPYPVIYMLGMNLTDFPRQYKTNQLSILAKEWALADRNLNLDDKQIFIDMLLMVENKLYISYIGLSSHDNQEIEPSSVINLLMDVIRNSVENGEELLSQITESHALHPFYNNKSENYSGFWARLNGTIYDNLIDRRWDFKQDKAVLAENKSQQFLNLNLTNLIKTLIYTNYNLYRVLGINNQFNQVELIDTEDLNLITQATYKHLYLELTNLTPQRIRKLYANAELVKYLHLKGVIGYEHIGDYQLDTILDIYQEYIKFVHQPTHELYFYSTKYNLTIKDKVMLEGNNLIIYEEFADLKSYIDDMSGYPVSLKLLATSLVTSLVARFAEITDNNGNVIEIDKIYLHLMSLEKEHYRYEIAFKSDPAHILGELLAFYVYSLTNPVLVHSAAINKYLVSHGNDKYSKVLDVYQSGYNNSGLNKLLLDPVFSGIANNYFVKCSELAIPNTLIQIGQLLDNILLIKVAAC